MKRHWRLNDTYRSQQWFLLSNLSGYNAIRLAKLTGITVRQLERYFQKDFNRSPQDWLNEQRIIAARYLLLNAKSVKSIAIQLGYKQPSHFSHEFKRYYGVSPSKYLEVQTHIYPNVAVR